MRAHAVERQPAPPPWPAPAEGARGRWPWWLALCAVAVAMVALVGWQYRMVLLTDARVHGWMTQACEVLGCEIGVLRYPQAVRVVERDLSAVSGGALRLTATLANTAAVPVRWPEIGLRLTGLDGRILDEHRLPPRAYLAEGAPEAMLPGGSWEVAVRVPDSEPPAHGFEIRFR